MSFAEFLDRTVERLRRASPILLSGFAVLWAVFPTAIRGGSGHSVDFVFLVTLKAAVLGIIIQGTRYVTFDFLRVQAGHDAPLDAESPHTLHYALLANAAVLWPAVLIGRLIPAPYEVGMTVLVAVTGLLVELGFIQGAMWNYKAATSKPGRAKKKTTKKAVR